MDKDREEIKKTYWRVGEVAHLLCITQSNLRFWTDIFEIELKRSNNKDRLFSTTHLKTMLAIKYLMDKELYTISGAKVKLKMWLKNKYVIPEEYLSATKKYQIELLYFDSLNKSNRGERNKFILETTKVLPSVPSQPQPTSTL